MNNAKHTQGPWAVDHAFGVGPISDSDDQSYGMVMAVADTYGDNRVADSRLIAAAPELLDACKNLLTLTQILANDEYEDIALVEFEIFSERTKSTRRLVLMDELAKASAAIAKATGAASSAAQELEAKETKPAAPLSV